jgi:transposase-like protein
MYSMDFRRRAVAYKDEGHTLKELKEAFGIPAETYYQWKRNLDSGYYQTGTVRERRRKIDKNALKQAIAEKPDAYLRELAAKFSCTETAVFYALEKLAITRKKNASLTARSPRQNARNIQKG